MERSKEETASTSSEKTENQPLEFGQSKLVEPARSSQESKEGTSEELEPPKNEEPLIEPPKNEEPLTEPPKNEEPLTEPPKNEEPLTEPPKNNEPILLSSDDEEDIIMQKDALKNSLKASTITITPPTLANDDEVYELQSDSEDEVQGSSKTPLNTTTTTTKRKCRKTKAEKALSNISLGLSISSLSSSPESDDDAFNNKPDSIEQPRPKPRPPRCPSTYDPLTIFKTTLESTRSELQTGFVFDTAMTYHEPLDPLEDHPEKPERLFQIFSTFDKQHVIEKCKRIGKRRATKEELELVHNRLYINELEELDDDDITVEEIKALEEKYAYKSLYFNASSYNAAVLAAGSLTNLMEAVINDEIKNGFAIIRPPGHHAERDMPMGFCLFNNVAVAVKCCQKKLGVKKVLIVDWDIHFGNGTQDIFSKDENVLYISLHRYEDASYYPEDVKGGANYVGQKKGFTINIPWSCTGVTDADYIYAFNQVILPIAHEFNPEVVVVSAGFDAAAGDPLGECLVSPAGYGNLTHMLMSLAGGKVVLALEGGYDLPSIAISALASMRVLMGEAPAGVDPSLAPSPQCQTTIKEVKLAQQEYWNCLN